ncbi:MAG: metal ABC transporter ATP-binding protein [Patescibacteria group bacterium]
MAKILEVKNLSVKIEETEVLNDISFGVEEGEIAAIIGPNGAGKTMLVKTLMGFLQPARGTFAWKKDVKIGYIPQKFVLEKTLPLSVGEFLRLRPDAKAADVPAALRLVGLPPEISGRPVGALSGGQAQRVIVAWAIIGDPDVLIFDEPTESIDVAGQESIYNLLHDFHERRKMTIFFVSHDLNIVYRYAERVICLNDKRIVHDGAPQEVLDPRHLEAIYGSEIHLVHPFHEHAENGQPHRH